VISWASAGRESSVCFVRPLSASRMRRAINAPESRFDLAYNAAHALALAALRIRGYRAEKRYIVFQALPHTFDDYAPTWRLLDRCHRERNATEYEGITTVDERLLEGLIAAAFGVEQRVRSFAETHGLSLPRSTKNDQSVVRADFGGADRHSETLTRSVLRTR